MRARPTNRVLAIAVGSLGGVVLSACGTNGLSELPSGGDRVEPQSAPLTTSEISDWDLPVHDRPVVVDDAQANAAEDIWTISPTSMGPAQLGMTLAELRQAGLIVGESEPWISDFDAIPVSDGDEVLFSIVHGSWEEVGDRTAIEHLVTENPKFITPEGIGPASTIAQAEAVYGQPTLGYNIENHSREGIQFERLLWSDYSFEPLVPDEPEAFAGIYVDSDDGTYFETNAYRDDAVIGSISIDTRE